MLKSNLKNKFTYILLLLFIIISTFTSCTNDTSYQDLNKLYYQLVDNYDSKNYTEKELFEIKAKEEFIKNLLSFNKDLKDNNDLTFLEIGFITIEIQGKWNKPKNFANGYGNKDLTNQEVIFNGKEMLITPVNSIQISKEAQKFLNKNWFQEEDFIKRGNHFPLILGSEFKEYYNIGDKISFLFLFEECIGYVSGFIQDGEKLVLDDYTIETDLDSVIVLPYFNELEESSIDFSKEFLMNYNQVRNNGYIFVEDKKDFLDKKKLVEELAKKNDVDFTVLRGY